MKRSVVLVLAGGIAMCLLGAVPVRAQQQQLPHPSTSDVPHRKWPFVAVTDLDLGAADATGKVGQEIVVVYPFGPPSSTSAGETQFRAIAISPDGSLRFDVTKSVSTAGVCTVLACPDNMCQPAPICP